MKKEVGLWIDHGKAIIVIIHDGLQEFRKIKSSMPKGIYFTSENEDVIRDSQFEDYLSYFYDEVIAYICDAQTIQIFGPGEAKSELEKRIVRYGIKANLHIEAADKMTDTQISAKVRDLFWKESVPLY